MDKPKTTPRDFFLWAGAMLFLYGSVVAFLALIFDYINYTFPDALSYLPADAYQSGISYEMSSFIIMGAACIILLRVIHRSIEHDPSRADVWVRRWALYLTLFIAGVTVVGDLIVILNAFLSGEDITESFLLKVLLVLFVASVGFMHFLADLRGYWAQYPERSRRVSIGVALLGVLTIAAGFFIVGTPWDARLYRFDEQKVSDLQQIQSEVFSYWQSAGKLPQNLGTLDDPITNTTVPTDPQSGQMYEYQISGPTSFALCATFNKDSRGIPALQGVTTPVPAGVYGNSSGVDDNWQHGNGRACFLRTIDPSRYPPIRAATPTPTAPVK